MFHNKLLCTLISLQGYDSQIAVPYLQIPKVSVLFTTGAFDLICSISKQNVTRRVLQAE